MLNTTRGAVPRPGERVGRTLNTSRLVEEDLRYEDEEPEIIAVLPATGWVAVLGETVVPLVAWVAEDSGRMYGVSLGDAGRVDLVENDVEKLSGFSRYEQANETKEKHDESKDDDFRAS